MELLQVWRQQKEYNDRIKLLQERSSSEWMETYILGTMSELGELLQEINWKKNRQERRGEFGPNVAAELADITKFVFSMWQQMGMSPQKMLESCWQKGTFLEQKFIQEYRPKVEGRLVLILDLDGVVADFRKGFESWIQAHPRFSQFLPAIMQERAATLHMDVNNGWSYPLYNQAKLEFEETGGYATLPVFDNYLQDILQFQRIKPYTVVWTARPGQRLERVWKDTWDWISEYGIKVDEFHFGREERVQDAYRFSEDGNYVIAIDDDPSLARRYSSALIPTLLIPHSYNLGTLGMCIRRLGPDDSLLVALKEAINVDELERKEINV